MINPNKIKLFSIRTGSIEKLLSDFGFSVFSTDFSKFDANTFASKFNKMLKEVKEVQPDIFYFFKDNHLPPSFFTVLRNELPNTKFVMRFWDQRGTVPDFIQSRKGCIDTIVLNNRDHKQYKMYENFGIKHLRTLYNATSKEEFYPLNIYRPYCVFFGGSHYKHFPLSDMRLQLINTLRKKFKTIIYGGGWGFPTNKVVRRQEYSKALQLSHINIGINHYNITQYYSERTIQNPASGRLHITYYIPRMEKDFGPNHRNVVWFKSIDECVDLVNFYLKNERARKKIERSGRELILRKFGHDKFVKIFANIFYESLGFDVQRVDY